MIRETTTAKLLEYVDANGPQPHATLAREFNLSRERVRQLVRRNKKLSDLYDSIRRDKTLADYREQIEKRMDRYGVNLSYDEFYRDKLRAKQCHILSTKKSNGKKRGWDVTLTHGDLQWPTYCPVLGLELDYYSPRRLENSPSFDRVDSSIGYVKGNIRIISWRANRIKNDGGAEEHRKIAEYIDSHESCRFESQ